MSVVPSSQHRGLDDVDAALAVDQVAEPALVDGDVVGGGELETLRGVRLVEGDLARLERIGDVEDAQTLREPGDRMVLGPACDGGYYLIGLKHPHKHLFAEIAWGTQTVARTTCERAAEIGLATTLLPEWYDVDDIETLRWLREELAGNSTRFREGGLAPASRGFLGAVPEMNP